MSRESIEGKVALTTHRSVVSSILCFQLQKTYIENKPSFPDDPHLSFCAPLTGVELLWISLNRAESR